jgi:hypothetical protein
MPALKRMLLGLSPERPWSKGYPLALGLREEVYQREWDWEIGQALAEAL